VSSRTGVGLSLRLDLVEQRFPEPGEVSGEVVVLAPGGFGQVGQELAQLGCEGCVLKVLVQNPRLGCTGGVGTIHTGQSTKICRSTVFNGMFYSSRKLMLNYIK